MAKSHLKLAPPTEVNQTVAPARPRAELQTREHLTPGEVELLVEAAKANRHGHRDATMILVAFRHGLRAAEVATSAGTRSSSTLRSCMCGGSRTARPAPTPCSATRCVRCAGCSGRAIRRRSSSSASADPRSRRLASRGWSSGQRRPASKLKAHPHMLREACGYALADRGYDTRAIQVWLGHRFRRWRCANHYQPSPAAPAAA